jgi:hypothetical protein
MRFFERTVDELAHDVRINSEQIAQFASCPISVRRRHYQGVGVIEERIPKRSSIDQTEVIAGLGRLAACVPTCRLNSQLNFPPKIHQREGGREPFGYKTNALDRSRPPGFVCARRDDRRLFSPSGHCLRERVLARVAEIAERLSHAGHQATPAALLASAAFLYIRLT